MIIKKPPLRLISNKKGLSYKYRSAFYTSVRKNSFIDIHFFKDYMFQLRAVNSLSHFIHFQQNPVVVGGLPNLHYSVPCEKASCYNIRAALRIHRNNRVFTSNGQIVPMILEFIPRAVRTGLFEIVSTTVTVGKEDNLFVFRDIVRWEVQINDPVTRNAFGILYGVPADS